MPESTPPGVEFKGTTLSVMQIIPGSLDRADLEAAVTRALGSAAGFFDGDPAVLDLSRLSGSGAGVDWGAVQSFFHGVGIQLVGVCNAPGLLAAAARGAGLASLANDALLPPRRSRAEPRAPGKSAEPPPAPPATPSMIIDKPLRSGQQIYARGSDLIVMAMVSAGAEVIADGNIHIYAPLRGRALAGARGDANARILTTCFEAELVSVAGVYRTFEGAVPADLQRCPVQVRLEEKDGKGLLRVAPLSTQ
ncbi:MAG: septum site-determining protein MinC [Proteobacteria bacterium]|nr:septum site-determining protein MinC [Pseudomonadota bacterium]HQR04183.1 septum site-determining protein MinC [Rhodocyclaceae bacterium]